MIFALFGALAILWSMTVLRWSVARSHSPWRRRVAAVSIAAAAGCAISVAADGYRMLALRNAPAARLSIVATDMGGWWRLAYSRAGIGFETANELHVPSGERVAIDVAGSPEPVLLVAQTGMKTPRLRRVRMIVDAPADFERWFDHQRQPAIADQRWLFRSCGCHYCHVLRGVADDPSQVAPDLTHFASRSAIGGIALPNDRGDLEGWIVNSHALDAASTMPENNIDPEVLHRLAAYLEQLR